MRCLSCHYELKNLPEHRCPECGRAFNPKKRRSFLSDADLVANKGDRHFWIAIAILGLLVCVIFAVWGPGVLYYIMR